MALVKPTLSFELGLTAGINDAIGTVAWTDITPYVRSWSTSRGRQVSRPPAHFEPGQASLVLDNNARRFDPTNTAGPYSPNLKPAKVRLRIRANWPGILPPDLATVDEASKWSVFANCTLARAIPAGGPALAMTAVAAGAMEAFSPIAMAGTPVTEGQTYTAVASFLAGVGAPPCSITILWYAADGSPIVNSTGATVVANTVGETQAFVTAVAPVGAAFAALFPAVVAGAAGNVHYVRKFGLQPGASTAWTAPYDIFTGYVKRWPPVWTGSATSTVTIAAVDALGAPLNLATLQNSLWTTMVRHDKPKAWYRLGESSGTVAADATSHRLDGQYQGSPRLGLDGLVLNSDGDKAAGFPVDSRLSVPYKNLITAYPWTFETWFKAPPDLFSTRMIFSAYDGASIGWRQAVQFFIPSNSPVPADAGKIIALVANPYPNGTQSLSTITVDDGFLHHLVIVMASSTSLRIWIDGVDRTNATVIHAHNFPDDLITGYAIGNNPASPFGEWHFDGATNGVIDEVVIYDYALSNARILKHYQQGSFPALLPPFGMTSGSLASRLLDEGDWPSADTDTDNGASTVQVVSAAGSVVANLQKIEDAEQGAVFVDEGGILVIQDRHSLNHAPYNTSQVTLGQGVGALSYEAPVTWGNDDQELYNQASGSRLGGPHYVLDDAASQAEYRERALPSLDGLWNSQDGDVVDLLSYRAQRYAQPMASVRQVRLHPAAQPALYPYVLGLGLRSRVTIEVQPPGGGPLFSQESHLERITHEVDDQGDWWVTWDVSAADTTPFLVLDDPVLDVLDAGNRLSF